MKKVYALIAFLFVALSVQAQIAVTFAVDMSDEGAVSAVFVAGEFQSWTPGNGALADQGNGVWARTYNLAPGTYQYKFGKGTDWGNNEGQGITATCGVDDNNGGFNRQVVVSNDFEVTVYDYDSCDESNLTVSINEVSTVKSLEIFPNPMLGTATIRFDNAGAFAHDVEITNINGQIVRQYRGVQGNVITVERGNLAAGLYLVTFRNDRGESGTVRLMMQ